MSAPAAHLDGNPSPPAAPSAYGTFPSPLRDTRHVEFRKYLKRPHLTEPQRTLSDALRAAKSREEQETLLPDDDHAGSDGCFNGQGEPVGPRDVRAPDPNHQLRVYFNIHRYVPTPLPAAAWPGFP